MSKKRPSDGWPANNGFELLDELKGEIAYWSKRLFKNTFTYKGRVVETRRWSVKIQFQGRRKTFSLAAPDRANAALEAFEIYSKLLAGGWPRLSTPLPSSPSNHAFDEELSSSKESPAFWKPRLVVRKYTETLGPRLRRELSAHIEHQGIRHYFPLGTEDPDDGASRSAEIYQTILTQGWAHAKSIYPRECIVGILWASNPFACTYSTLYTFAARYEESVASRASRSDASLLIVEADCGISRALSFWVQRGTMIERVRICDSTETAWRAVGKDPPTWVLVNQELPQARDLVDQLPERQPGVVAFAYGIFENSDDIFASVTGVSRGYMLRRRPPASLLEPIGSLLSKPNVSADEAARQIKIHFQKLFDPSVEVEERRNPVSLTRREQEILDFLSQGYLDKEIATNLGISAWTVHSHLKRIYEKLGVHTRTEAVVKYLQK